MPETNVIPFKPSDEFAEAIGRMTEASLMPEDEFSGDAPWPVASPFPQVVIPDGVKLQLILSALQERYRVNVMLAQAWETDSVLSFAVDQRARADEDRLMMESVEFILGL